jgi:cytochrome c biogenesis protein CcdA
MPKNRDEQDATLKVHREHHEMLPVWFFIGVLLLFYGMVILFVGIREYHHPPAVVLARYHANLWGGILLIVIGLIFTLGSHPRRRRR